MTRPIDDLFGDLSQPLGPTDWPEPAQLRRKAEHRRTVRRVAVASSVAVVAAFAIAVPAVLTNQHKTAFGPASVATSVIKQRVAPVSTASPVAPSQPRDTAAPGVKYLSPLSPGAVEPTGRRVQYGSISVVVPKGWTEASAPQFGFPEPTNKVCIAPPATAGQRTFDSCAGLEIWYGGFLPGAYSTSFAGNRETSPAWFHGKGKATCPATGSTPAPLAVSPGGPDVEDFYLLGGGKHASHDGWTVSCDDGSSFKPQAWYLPTSHYLFLSYLSDPTAEAILATVR